MNSSSEVATSENSSLAVNEEEASPLLYGRYGYSLIIIGAVAMFVDVICMRLVRKSKTIFKNLQVYIISLMACYFFVAFSFTLAPLGFLLFKSTFAIDLGVSFGRSVVISSLLHTAVLSLDRLLSIKLPNFYSFPVTPRICYGVCFCIWFVSALNNIVVHAFVTFQPVGGRFNVGVYSSFVFVYFSCLLVYIGSSRSIIVCAKEHIRQKNTYGKRTHTAHQHRPMACCPDQRTTKPRHLPAINHRNYRIRISVHTISSGTNICLSYLHRL